jgi:hypothetical protein
MTVVSIFLFVFHSTLIAQQKDEEKKLSLAFVNQIQIPTEIGILKETYLPDKKNIPELIVCIQDAHCHYEAQINISKIVKILVEKFGFSLLNVEGTAGLIDTKPFSSFKDHKVKMDFAEYFIKQGKITGPEYLSITSDLPFTLFGIEEDSLYAENYNAFMKILKYRDRVNFYTTKFLERLDSLKEHLFHAELLALDKEARKLDDKQIEFADFTKTLEKFAKDKQIDLSSFPNFILQMKTRALEEQNDFKKVEEQRSALVSKFSEMFENNDKDKMKNILYQTLSFKTKEVDPESYYQFLVNTAKENKIDLSPFPLVGLYTEYLHHYNAIDKTVLIDESKEVLEHLKKSVYKTVLEADLDHLYRVIRIIGLLFKLEVIKSDYLFFTQNKAEFNFHGLKDFITKHGPQYNVYLDLEIDHDLIDKNFSYVVTFYEAAMKRDLVLIKNALNRMKFEKKDRSVLITGGFHSEGISNILRKDKHPYLTIAPRITDPNAETPYLKVMQAQADSVKGYKEI